MNVISLITPYMRRVKLFIPMLFVGILMYFICLRWKSKLSPWWLYVGIAALVTLLITLLVKFFKWRHQKKMNAGLEAGLSEGDESKVDLGGEIKALRENWKNSLDQLKASRLGQNKAVLFQLPWYIIIGEPASGKSTLLRKSGLDFPVGDASVSGLHGTRNCDWWFANEAVFLDTAGRYVMETQEAEWVAFLDLLKKYRTKKPLNGVMVALPANSLLTKSHDELLLDGKRIRSRVDELIDRLGVNFPVYILCTKVDLVAGFVEFFGSLDQRYGEQMVGWTVEHEGETTFDREAFSERFEETAGRLFRMRPWLESSAKSRDLMKAFLYPEEFLNLGEPIREVLDIVFRPNIYQETPVCRGVYFSSGTQVGSPLAKALEEMAKNLNIPSDFGLGLEMEEEKEVRTYFIKDLVSEQVLKDKHMTWRTWQSEARTRKKRMGRGLIGVGILALAALLFTSSFFTNQDRLTAFQVSIPERAYPLEAGVGCLDTYHKAESPSMFDWGLNFSDELKPSMMDSFLKVFGEGCVEPSLEHFRGLAEAGPPKRLVGGQRVPDVLLYLSYYQRFIYLRQALQGRLLYDQQDWEKEYLDYLFDVLVRNRAAVTSESDVADLRRSLYAYAGPSKIEFHVKDLDEITDEFDRHLMGWLGEIESWVNRVKGREGRLEQDIDQAFNRLKEACLRNKVIPHDRPEKVYEVARILTDAVYPRRSGGGGSGGKPLAEITFGATTVTKVRKYMESAKKLSRPESEGGEVPPKVDSLLADMGEDRTDDQMAVQRKAQQSMLGYLQSIAGVKIPESSYDAVPTREGLRARRDTISRDVPDSANRAWDQIRQQVVVMEGRADTVFDPATGIRKNGWWDTLIDLNRAKTADVLQGEYLKKGLIPYLSGPQWRSSDFSEEEREIFTKARLTELVQLELLNQQSFFQKPELATSIAGSADDQMKDAISAFLSEMESFWLDELKQAIESPAETLTDLYRHVDMWSSTRKQFLITCAEIESAVTGIQKLVQNEADIPFLRATQETRKRLFNTFVACFRISTDPAVQRATTVGVVEAEFRPLKNGLEKVAGGAISKSEARRLLADLVQGARGLANPFAKALQVIKDLREQGGADSPEGMFARWMEPGIKRGQDQLVQLAADDINAEWSRRRQVWKSYLDSGKNDDFKRVFGEGGDYFVFRDDYMKPFFEIPSYRLRRKLSGANLAADVGLAKLENVERTSPDAGVRDASGAYIIEKMTLRIGTGPLIEGLWVEHTDPSGQSRKTKEFRQGDRIEIPLTWSPRVNGHLRFIVNLGNGVIRDSVFSWSGPWAVAKAFTDPRCQKSGGAYTWAHEDPGIGTWRVRLTVTGGMRLISFYQQYGAGGGTGTGGRVTGPLPTQAVSVVRR